MRALPALPGPWIETSRSVRHDGAQPRMGTSRRGRISAPPHLHDPEILPPMVARCNSLCGFWTHETGGGCTRLQSPWTIPAPCSPAVRGGALCSRAIHGPPMTAARTRRSPLALHRGARPRSGRRDPASRRVSPPRPRAAICGAAEGPSPPLPLLGHARTPLLDHHIAPFYGAQSLGCTSRCSHAGGSSTPLRSAPRRGASCGWRFEVKACYRPVSLSHMDLNLFTPGAADLTSSPRQRHASLASFRLDRPGPGGDNVANSERVYSQARRR
jgi:hypothetical protein